MNFYRGLIASILMMLIVSPVMALGNNDDEQESNLNLHTQCMYDSDFNHQDLGYAVNGWFVKSLIGVDMDAMFANGGGYIQKTYPMKIKGINGDNAETVVEAPANDTPLVINGVEYKSLVNIVADDYNMELVSLNDIKKELYGEKDTPCVYMINKHIIFDDAESYRLDKNFVLKTEVVHSSEIEALKGMPEFDVVRIYTKTKENMAYLKEKNAVRLR